MRLTAPWRGARDESWGRRLALAPLEPAGWLWSAGARLHRGLYARGLRPRDRLPCRVVSVGSVVVGGVAKTPAAAWLASALHRRGRAVALLSRGYAGGAGRAPQVVSDGRFLRGRTETAGDEPLVLSVHARGVPVLVDPDRRRAGWRALGSFGAEVLLLDDGFQHHRLERDVDVVLLDGALGLGSRRCLPRGPLREPLRALRRAHAVGVVDGPLPEADAERVADLAPEALRFAARREPLALRPLGGGAAEAPGRLAGREVGLLCGLARPATLRRSVEALGACTVAERTFPDHHAYRPRDLRRLAREAPLWVTTEKDAVKIQRHWVGDADVRVLSLRFAVEEPEALLDALEARLGLAPS